MYKIIRYGKRFNSKRFDAYDEARCYIRKWLRKNLDATGNPQLSEYGFSIQQYN